MITTPELKSALCAQIDTEMFFGFEGENPTEAQHRTAAARTLCGSCPELAACLDYALRVQVVGVWGGTTAKQRSGMRAARGIVAENIGSENFIGRVYGPSNEYDLPSWTANAS